jgi:hypothetical protein
MTRHFEIGQRVTLRPDRADAYGIPRGAIFTVARTHPHKHYARTWVILAERPVGDNTVDSRELRSL